MTPFAKYVRSRRQKLGLTQLEVAELGGMTPQWISLLERGRNRPGLATLVRLADALEVPREKLERLAEAHPEPTSHGREPSMDAVTDAKALAEFEPDYDFDEIVELARTMAQRSEDVGPQQLRDALDRCGMDNQRWIALVEGFERVEKAKSVDLTEDEALAKSLRGEIRERKAAYENFVKREKEDLQTLHSRLAKVGGRIKLGRKAIANDLRFEEERLPLILKEASRVKARRGK